MLRLCGITTDNAGEYINVSVVLIYHGAYFNESDVKLITWFLHIQTHAFNFWCLETGNKYIRKFSCYKNIQYLHLRQQIHTCLYLITIKLVTIPLPFPSPIWSYYTTSNYRTSFLLHCLYVIALHGVIRYSAYWEFEPWPWIKTLSRIRN